ncbi:MAG: hypothetical protein KGH64_06225, partial [Candidatus Micrarchaeota archaeon]|nr:hypothetical protein [Candidatus Micrarchaeota archaeon]
MKNKVLADHLRLIGQLRALNNDNKFSVAAYEKAARSILDLEYVGKAIENIDLHSIDGIGSSLRETVREVLSTGTSSKLVELSKKFPVEAMSMTRVQGIGPKKAFALYLRGYKNFDALHEAAKAGKLDSKLTEEVLFAATNVGRVEYFLAKNTAD